MTQTLSTDEKRVWRSFISAHTQMLDLLDRLLQQHSQMPLTDYQILEALHQSPDKKLRMSDLADEILLSRSCLTYRIDGLQKAGLISREACAKDRRGLYAAITESGSEIVKEVQPQHSQDIRTWFFDQFDSDELDRLENYSDRLNDKLASNL